VVGDHPRHAHGGRPADGQVLEIYSNRSIKSRIEREHTPSYRCAGARDHPRHAHGGRPADGQVLKLPVGELDKIGVNPRESKNTLLVIKIPSFCSFFFMGSRLSCSRGMTCRRPG